MKVEPEIQREILSAIQGKYEKAGESCGDFWIQVHASAFLDVLEVLQNHPNAKFDRFIDLCGVDYHPAAPRFESVVHLYSSTQKHRVRIRVIVPEATLKVPSITHIWKGANWQERESFDMYGISYEGHPNLTRILSPPIISVHPQRKDYPLKGDRDLGGDLQ
ncbi:MAG: NADH-quinone oxidoreductase subunit C [Bdellovibrionota bacterium]